MTNRSKMRLTHGGHKGAEAEFGRVAAQWKIPETTISYDGHEMEFSMNIDNLSDEQLEKGHVSMDFVFQTLGRRFAHTQKIRRVIYSMFHVVTRGDALFVVGWLQSDNHVKGGTGWGVELAKFFNREVHVFDQERDAWFTWSGGAWESSEPTLPDRPFSATGTRALTDAGRKAIADLFERSLGSKEA